MGSFGNFMGTNAASSLISGIFGTVNGFLDRSAQNKNIDKQIAAQAAENQKTREYNLNLAKMQNQWNLEQWNRENEYNTPMAQMQRLVDAGLNPDLFYQNGVSGMTAASSPSMTAGAPATPQDMSALGQKKTVGQALNEGLQSALVGSQVQLNESVARKNNAEAGGQEITNETLGEMNDAQLRKFADEHDLNGEQIENLRRFNENLRLTGQQLKIDLKVAVERYRNLPNDIYLSNLSRAIDIVFKDAQIRKALSEVDINEKIFKEELPAKIALLRNQSFSIDFPSAIMAFLSGALGISASNSREFLTNLGEKSSELVLNAIDKAVKIANNMASDETSDSFYGAANKGYKKLRDYFRKPYSNGTIVLP